MNDQINQVDLAFVVDTTGSMGSLITVAQSQMVRMLQELTQAAAIQLNLGVVEYCDHPPQDTLLYRVYPFTADMAEAQKTIQSLRIHSGGDEPEAVLDGIVAACRELSWRKCARRLLVLIGDAPPHGVGAHGDGFPAGCPCGETISSVTALAEETGVTIHSLGLTTLVNESFTALSALTGGQFFPGQQGAQAIQHIASILKQEFADLDLDRRVLALQQTGLSVDEIVQQLDLSRHLVSHSLLRLLSRDLIEVPVP